MSSSTLVLPLPRVRERLKLRRRWLALGALAGLALALRLVGIGAASFWSDEAFTALWIREPLGFLWGEGLAIETTPALYYTLLKGWAAVFGGSEAGLRSFSALCSALTVPLVHAIGRHFGPPAVGLAAAAIFAVMPMQVAFGQEARAYALLGLMAGLTLLSALAIARAAGPGWRRPGWPIAWFALASLALVYTHATAAFILAVLNLCLLGWLVRARAPRRALLMLVAADALVVLASLPQINAMLIQTGRHDMGWFPAPTVVNLLNMLNTLLVDPYSPQVLFRWSTILAFTLAGLLAWLLWRARPGRRAMLFLVGFPAGFFLLCVVVSAFAPFLIPRVLVWLGVPLAVLLAMVLQASRLGSARLLLVPVLAGTVLLGLHGTLVRVTSLKEDWRGLLAEVAARRGPADVVAVGPSTSNSAILLYGWPGVTVHAWVPEPMHPLLHWPSGFAPRQELAGEALPDAVRAGQPLWLLVNQQDARAAVTMLPADLPPPRRIERAGVMALHWPGTATVAGTADP